MQKRCYICSSSLKKDEDKVECLCGVRVHESCAVDVIHCPKCDRHLISITDIEDTLGG